MNCPYRYSWATVWGLAMLVLMGLPPKNMPAVRFFDGFDKLAHCGCFFVFAVLLLLGRGSRPNGKTSKIGASVFAVLVSGLFAFLTEAVQLCSGMGRTADWWDVFADFTGIGMAVFAYSVLRVPDR